MGSCRCPPLPRPWAAPGKRNPGCLCRAKPGADIPPLIETRPQAALPELVGNAFKPNQPRLSFLHGNRARLCWGQVQQMQLCAETEVCGATEANPPVGPCPEHPAPTGDPNPWGHPDLHLATPAHVGAGWCVMPGTSAWGPGQQQCWGDAWEGRHPGRTLGSSGQRGGGWVRWGQHSLPVAFSNPVSAFHLPPQKIPTNPHNLKNPKD